VGLDGVKYKTPNQTLAATLEAERVKRGGQAARAKARKELLSGDQAGDDAEAIGLTEQGYRNLLTVGYPYMVPSNIFSGKQGMTFDAQNPPPEYAQAVTGVLAFLARQDPTIVTGRGLVSDLCRSIVDTMYRQTTPFQHQSEEERRQKIKDMVEGDQDARRKLTLWEANGWVHAGLRKEDKFFPGEAGNIYFDPDYALFAPYVSAVNVMHLGKDEAEKAYKEADEKRSKLIKGLFSKYENMPEIKEKEARRLREEQERKERNERRLPSIKEIERRMNAWLEKQPVMDIAKGLKSKKEYVFYVDGIRYYEPEHTQTKKGLWPLVDTYGRRLSRENTQAKAATLDEYVEAYRRLAKDIPELLPVPDRDRKAWNKAREWQSKYDQDNRLGPAEVLVALAQEKLAPKPPTD
jgi:polyhydroxyalkanoate synthesis regulator phasin